MRTLHMLHPLHVAVGDSASTVRLGPKWYDQVRRGDYIELCTCRSNDEFGPDQTEDHVVRGKGKVEDVDMMPFYDIPAKSIANEHEERSRQYWGLYDSMRKAYGNDFGEQSVVTILVYERVE